MTSFHLPPDTEIGEQRAALADPKVLPFPPKAVPATATSALMIAEMTRKMCLEAAASYVDILRESVVRWPENVSAARMAKLLADVAGSIRELKSTDLPPSGPRTGDAA